MYTSAAKVRRQKKALKRISELYAIEDEIRGLPESERLAVRQQRSKVLLTSLHEWMVEKNGTLSKKIQTGRSVQLCTESVGCPLLLQ
nr:transposase [Escherichia coli]